MSASGRLERAGGESAQDFLERGQAKELRRMGPSEPWLLWAELPSLAPPWSVPREFVAPYFPEDTEDGPDGLTPWRDPPCGPIGPTDTQALERLQSTYAAAVTRWDRELGVHLEMLRRRDLYQDLLLILTSNEGLALGEHGSVGPSGPSLHEELIHLPLVVRLPGGAEAGRRITALTQPVDLFPTLLEIYDLPCPEVHGHSLLPLVRGEADSVRAYACAGLAAGGAVTFALRTPEWGLVLPVESGRGDPPRRPQLYVKPDDRWEVNDVRQHHLEWAEGLEKTLRGFVAATRQPGPLVPPPLPDRVRAPAQEATD
jgi:arylsulfatase A-like enzyme